MRCRQKVIEMDCPELSVPPLTLPLSVFLSDKDPRDHIFPFLILIFNFICLWGGLCTWVQLPLKARRGRWIPKSWSYWGLVVVSYMTWVLETDFSSSVEICLLLTPELHSSPGVIFSMALMRHYHHQYPSSPLDWYLASPVMGGPGLAFNLGSTCF